MTKSKEKTFEALFFTVILFFCFWIERGCSASNSLAYSVCFTAPLLFFTGNGKVKAITVALLLGVCSYLIFSDQFKILIVFVGFHLILTIFIFLTRILIGKFS